MSRSTIRRPLAWALFLIAIGFISPRLAAAKIEPPVVASLHVITSPTLGGQGVVNWAGVPDITPASATLIFTLKSPSGAVTSTSQAVAMQAGQASSVRYSFATPVPGAWRLFATINMTAKSGRFTQTTTLILDVPPSGTARLAMAKVLNSQEFAARTYQKTPVLQDPRGPVLLAAVPAFTVTGTFRFTNLLFNETGFTGTRVDPIRRARITVLDTSDGKTTTTLGTTLTTESGTFTFTVPAGTAPTTGRNLTIVLSAENNSVRVHDLAGSPYPVAIQVVQWQGGTLNLGTRTMTLDQSAPWNILDALVDGCKYLEAVTGAPPSGLTVRWALGNNAGTYYVPFANEIWLLGTEADGDEFDDSVILHEFGHFVARNYSYDKSPGGYHSWSSRISPQLAWSEGWATFFSSAVRNSPFYLDTSAFSSLSIEIETPTDKVSGEDMEGAIAAVLWDIFDSHNDGQDLLSDGIGNIWRVVHEYFTFRRQCIIRDLYDGWLALNLPNVGLVQNILTEHEITYPALVVTSLAINNGAATAGSLSVILNNRCVGTPTAYMASESSNFTGGAWIPYTPAPAYTFSPGQGNRGVYFKVKDALGNESAPIVDTIIHGQVPVTDLAVDAPPVNGMITSEFDYDLYRVTIVTTGTYTFDTADVTISDATMEVYGPGSTTTPLEVNDDGHGSVDYMPAITLDLKPGVYTVKIAGFATSAGAYTTWVKSGPPPSQLPELSLKAPAISGTIDTSQGILVQEFIFVVETEGPYTIETREGTLYDSVMTLIGPGRNSTAIVEEDDDGGKGYMSLISRNLLPGLYKVRVASYDSRISGSFTIRAYPGLRGTVKPLAINAAAVGDSITSATDFDWYSFHVTLPGNYMIETQPGTLTDSYLYLYGPNTPEKFMAEADEGAGGMASISRHFEAGTYYFKVEGTHPDDIGTYRVRVKTDIKAAALPAAATWTRGEISGIVPAAWFQFTVTAPTGYVIETAAGTLTDTVLELYGPNDPLKLLARNDDISTKDHMSRLTVYLQPGTYIAKVQGYGYQAYGTYLIRRFTIPVYPAQALAINAAPRNAAISYSGEGDWYSFTIPAQGNYIIETLPGSLRSNYMRIYGPGNQVIMIAQDGYPGRTARAFLTMAPGTYYVRVMGYTAADIGTYTIQVRSEVTTLAVEGASVTRTILDPRDGHWYAFTVYSPGSYTIDTLAGTQKDNYMRLYGPNGRDAILAADNDSGPGAMARITRTLEAGTYYVKVQALRAKDVGTYSINVRRTVQPLMLNAAQAAGKIDFSNESDWYSFKLTAGGIVTIDTAAGTLTDSVVRLYGPNNMTTYISKDDNSGPGEMSSLKITLTPGTYTIRVNGRMEHNIGTYKIGVSYRTK